MNFILRKINVAHNYFEKFFQNLKYQEYYHKYKLDRSFRFNGKYILIYGDGKLEVGKSSYIGGLSTIQLNKDRKVSIGSNCRVSHNVRIYTSSPVADQDFSNYLSLKAHSGDIIIEDNVWIGANVFINPGIVIGNNAIVGANSVVTKSVPPFAIVGGVPAKLIRFKRIDA